MKLLKLLSLWPATCVATVTAVACMAGAAHAAKPADLLAAYTALAKAPADAARGEESRRCRQVTLKEIGKQHSP